MRLIVGRAPHPSLPSQPPTPGGWTRGLSCRPFDGPFTHATAAVVVVTQPRCQTDIKRVGVCRRPRCPSRPQVPSQKHKPQILLYGGQEGLLCDDAESATLQPAAHPDAHHGRLGRKNSTSPGHWLPQMRDMHRFDWPYFVSDETGIARPL